MIIIVYICTVINLQKVEKKMKCVFGFQARKVRCQWRGVKLEKLQFKEVSFKTTMLN